jgi:probable F420-dependent oxidoreductase
VCDRERRCWTPRGGPKTEDSTFLIRDHFIAEPFGHQLAPLTALATVAAVARTLRIGSLVFANEYRHPVVLAKEVGTLDVLSEGRFELGLGAGFSRAEYQQAGIAFDPPHVRAERLEEALHVVKGLFSEAPFTFVGQRYSVSSLNSFPKPLQRPHPPILVGAASSRMLSIAARHADIIGLQTVSVFDRYHIASPADLKAAAAKMGQPASHDHFAVHRDNQKAI